MGLELLLGLAPIATGLLGQATSPDRPKIEPFEFDPITADQIDEMAMTFNPHAKAMTEQQSEVAIQMMNGELPDSVKSQIEMFAAEKSVQGGYGQTEGRSINVTARDLGLTSLDMMERGMNYANYLSNSAYDMATGTLAGNLDMAYQGWAQNAEIEMAAYRDESRQHSAMWEGITGTTSNVLTSYMMSNASKNKKAPVTNNYNSYSLIGG